MFREYTKDEIEDGRKIEASRYVEHVTGDPDYFVKLALKPVNELTEEEKEQALEIMNRVKAV